MDIPLCPHSRPAWHYCPSCPKAEIQQPLQIEYPAFEYEPAHPKDETEKSTVIVIEF